MIKLLSHKANGETRYLLSLLRPHKNRLLLFLSASLVTALLDGISIGLVVPLLSFLQGLESTINLPGLLKWGFQFLERYPLEIQLILSLTLVVLAVLVKNGILGFALKQGVWLSNRVNGDVRSQVVNRLLTVGIDFHHQSKVGELIDKTIQYTHWIKDLLVFSASFVVFSLMLIILIALLVLLSWPLTLVTMLLGSLAISLVALFMKRLSRFGDEAARTGRELTHAVQENLAAVHLIKAYGREAQQISYVGEKIENHVAADNRLTANMLYVQPLTEALGVLAIGLMLGASILLFPENPHFSLPRLLPFAYILIRIVTTLKVLNDGRGVIAARWPYLRLVYDLVRPDNKPHIRSGETPFPRLESDIVFDSVSFAYDSDKTVLHDLSFTIPLGQTTAIVGASGSGKSTIVNLLLRFYDPDQGCILVNGSELSGLQVEPYRRKIAVVSQETFIFNESARYNIAFGVDDDVSDEAVIEAARNAGAHEFISQLPEGYDTVLGDRGVMISGGQRQRIAIARAILRNPEILILDEATSSLDSITEEAVHETLSHLGRSRTVIIVAHRSSTIRNAGHVVVLKDGRIAEAGPIEKLTGSKGEYDRLMQAAGQ